MKKVSFEDRSNDPWPILPDVSRFVRYLSKTGWSEIKQDDPTIIVFGTHQFDEIPKTPHRRPFVILPANDTFSNARALIRDAIDLLAYFRKSSGQSIVAEIFRYEYDVIRQRIEAPNISGIPLKLMPDLMKHVRDWISRTAQLEETKGEKPLRLGKSTKAQQSAEEIVKKCQFGHTFAGSFGISIEIPIQANEGFLISEVAFATPTLERNIVQRIAIGLHDAQNAIQSDSPDEITSNYQNGFNSDICSSMENILKILSSIEESKVEYSFNWSPLVQKDENIPQQPILFVPETAANVFQAAKAEMQRLHGEKAIVIHGEVISLTDDPEKAESAKQGRRTIKIRCRNRDDIDTVRVKLSETDYKTAAEVHVKHGWLSIKGVIEQDGASHRMLSPHNVKEIEPKSSLFYEPE